MQAHRCAPARSQLRRSTVSAAVSLLLLASFSQAEAKGWICLSGFWDASSCWSPAGVPTAADDVVVRFVGSTGATLKIDALTESFLGGDAVANALYVGSPLGTASIVQSGSSLVAGIEVIGDVGTGAFNQSGGSHTVTQTLTLGGGYPGWGTYNLSAGTLTAGSIVIGVSGQGTFNQTGGSVSAASLNFSTGTPGGNPSDVYSLSGGTLNVSGAITNGAVGLGYFNLDGGSLTVGSGNIRIYGFNLGSVAGTTGSYVQGSGTVESGVMRLGLTSTSSGNYTLNDGNLSAIYLYVGANGTGSFSQVAGYANLSELDMGYGSGAAGTYAMSGGTLSTGRTAIGGAGSASFNQSGGTHSTGGLAFGAASSSSGNSYTLSGGTLNVSGSVTTGSGGSTFNLDGGSLTVGTGNIEVITLNLGSVAGASGSYTQTFGTVSVSNLVLGTVGSTAIYTLAGGTLNIGTSLTADGASALNLNGGSFVGPGSATLVNLNLGTTEGSVFTLNVGNGGGANTFASLSAVAETIGGLGAGHVIQTGGSNTVGELIINDRYTYNGGSLIVTSSLTNNGALEMSGTSLVYGVSAVNNGLLSVSGRSTRGLPLHAWPFRPAPCCA